METTRKMEIETGDDVWVRNYYGEKWLSGCKFIRQIDDELSKPFLVKDWNGFERRFRYVRKTTGNCDICHSCNADKGIICHECEHIFGICSECSQGAAKCGGIAEVTCPSCKTRLALM